MFPSLTFPTSSISSPDDAVIAANALSCVARVAGSHRIMPTVLYQAGVCDAVIKLVKRHIGKGPVLHHACLTIHIMSSDNVEICEKYGMLTACDSLPRAMKSCLDDPSVVISGCMAIATLGSSHENRVRFSPTVACEVVVQGTSKHMDNAEAAEKGCAAAISLATGHMENCGKLVLAGACAGECHSSSLLTRFNPLHFLSFCSFDSGAIQAHRQCCGGQSSSPIHFHHFR
jgi:hypothetical protein